MVAPRRHIPETPARWLLFAVAGTVVCFSAFAFAEISPVLIFLSMIPMVLSPCFLVITTWKYGFRLGIAAAGASFLFLLALFPPPTALLFLVQFAAAGLILGEGLRRRTPPLPLLFTATLVPALLMIAAGAVYLLHASLTPAQLLEQGAETLRLAFAENVKRFQLDPEELMRYRHSVEILITFFKTSFPALLFINAFTMVFVNLLLSLRISGRFGLDRSHIPFLREASIPFHWVWALIVSGLLYLLKVPYLKWAGLNAAMVFLLGYLMQGFAILSFHLNRTRLPAAARGLIYLACLMNLPLIVALCGIGLFDTWFDFRKRPAPKNP